jgi:hypothetical protein
MSMVVPGPPRFATRRDPHGVAKNRCKNRLGVFKRSVQSDDRALAVALSAAFTHIPGSDGPDPFTNFAAALNKDREIFCEPAGARVLTDRGNSNLAEWRLRYSAFLAEDLLDLGDKFSDLQGLISHSQSLSRSAIETLKLSSSAAATKV